MNPALLIVSAPSDRASSLLLLSAGLSFTVGLWRREPVEWTGTAYSQNTLYHVCILLFLFLLIQASLQLPFKYPFELKKSALEMEFTESIFMMKTLRGNYINHNKTCLYSKLNGRHFHGNIQKTSLAVTQSAGRDETMHFHNAREKLLCCTPALQRFHILCDCKAISSDLSDMAKDNQEDK